MQNLELVYSFEIGVNFTAILFVPIYNIIR